MGLGGTGGEELFSLDGAHDDRCLFLRRRRLSLMFDDEAPFFELTRVAQRVIVQSWIS